MEWRSIHGETLLMRAVDATQRGSGAPIVRLLLARGFDADTTDHRRRTALMRAAARGAIDAVKLLLDAGANPFLTDGLGNTAVDWGRKAKDRAAGYACSDACRALMERAIVAERAEADEQRRLAAVEVPLIANDSLVALIVEELDDPRCMPLLHEALRRHRRLNRALFEEQWKQFTPAKDSPFAAPKHAHERRFFVDVESPRGWTPLARAASLAEAEICRELIERGADVNVFTRRGHTPLHWAAMSGILPVSSVLLRAGADYNLVTKTAEARTPLVLAVYNGHTHYVRWLVNYITEQSFGKKEQARQDAQHARTDIERLRLEGVDYSKFLRQTLQYEDAQGKDALTYARERGHEAIAELLEHVEERLAVRQVALDREKHNSAIVRCPMACGFICRADDMRRHVKELCDRRPIMCPDCGQMVKEVTLLHKHQEAYCPKRIVACPRQHLGCPETMIAVEADEHLEHRCPKRTVMCRLECGTRLHFDDRPEHEESRCRLRMMDCELKCGGWLPVKEARNHYRNVCPHRVVNCSLECGRSMMEKDRVVHIITDCINKPTPCPLGCGDVVSPPSKMRLHLAAFCSHRIVKCKNGCGVPGLLAKYQEEHQSRRCAKTIVTCTIGCGLQMRRELQPNHEIQGEWGSCPNRSVRCRFDMVGKRIHVREPEGERRRTGTIDHYIAKSGEHVVMMETGLKLTTPLHSFDWLEFSDSEFLCGLMSAAERDDHEAHHCPYRKLECEYSCGFKYRAGWRDEHLGACDMRIVECRRGCREEMPLRDRHHHEEDLCVRRPVQCDCGAKMDKSKLKEHRKTVCPLQGLFCPNLCGEKLTRLNLNEHMALHCSKRTVECERGCGTKIFLDEYDRHQPHCPYRLVRCPNECGLDVAQQELQHHKSFTCRTRPMRCPYDCGAVVQKQDLVSHKATCEKRPIKCSMGCGNVVPAKQQWIHELRFCDRRFDSCRLGCGLAVRQNDADIKEHELRCRKRVAACPHNCGDHIRIELLRSHERMCLRREVVCGAESKECRRQLRSWVMGEGTSQGGGTASRGMKPYLVRCDLHNETVLTHFALINDVLSAEAVLDMVNNEGVDVETRRGQTALTIAARAGSVNMMRLLLERGADANYETARGVTPLMEATVNEHWDCVHVLLEYQASISYRTRHGRTAVSWCRNNNKHKMLKFLLDQTELIRNTRELFIAISCYDYDGVKRLTKGGVNRPHSMQFLSKCESDLEECERMLVEHTKQHDYLKALLVVKEKDRREATRALAKHAADLKQMADRADELDVLRRTTLSKVDDDVVAARQLMQNSSGESITDVVEISKPSVWMVDVMHAVCIVMQAPTTLMPDKRDPYKKCVDWFTSGQRFLDSSSAVPQMLYLDRSALSPEKMSEATSQVVPQMEKHLEVCDDLDQFPFFSALIAWVRATTQQYRATLEVLPLRDEALTLRGKHTKSSNDFAEARVTMERTVRETKELEQDFKAMIKKRVTFSFRADRLRREYMVARLLSRRTITGHTAVSWAAANGVEGILKVLLRFGGCPSLADDVLDKAARVVQTIFRIHLFRCGRTPWTTATSAQRRREDTANEAWLAMVVHRCRQARATSRVPLHEALFNGHVDCANLLIKSGASVGVKAYVVPEGPPPWTPSSPVPPFLQVTPRGLGLVLHPSKRELQEAREAELNRPPLQLSGAPQASGKAIMRAPPSRSGGSPPVSRSGADSGTSTPVKQGQTRLALTHVAEQTGALVARVPADEDGTSVVAAADNHEDAWRSLSERARAPPLEEQIEALPSRGPGGVAIDWTQLGPKYSAPNIIRFSVPADPPMSALGVGVLAVFYRQHRSFVRRRGWLKTGAPEMALRLGFECEERIEEALQYAIERKKQSLNRRSHIEEEKTFLRRMERCLKMMDFEGVQDLLNRGAPADLFMRTGHTPLTLAASMGTKCIDMNGDYVLAAQALLDRRERRPVLDRETPLGHTALSIAAFNGRNYVVEMLLDRGADVNKVLTGGKTALIYATINGKPDTVRLLIERGATMEWRDDDGKTAFDYAVELRWIPIASQISQLRHFGSTGIATATRGKAAVRIMCDYGCGATVGLDTREAHLLDCPKRTIPCRLGCDIHDLWAKDREAHERTDCPKRLVHCTDAECKDVIIADELEHHLAHQCMKRIIPCPNGCGKKLVFEKQDEHLDNVCLRRRVACSHGCGQDIVYQEHTKHWEHHCGKREVVCPLGCGTHMRAEHLSLHESDECRLRKVQCKWGCDSVVYGYNQQEHETEVCEKREVRCANRCGITLVFDQFPQHNANHCVKRFVSCPLECSASVRFEDLPDHQANTCSKRRATCRLGCGLVMLGASLAHHEERECPKRVTKCGLGCGKYIVAEKSAEHKANTCARRMVPCDILGCFREVPYDELFKHKSELCKYRVISCPRGCKATVQDRFLQEHLDEKCDRRVLKCRFCNDELFAVDLLYHETKQCPMRPNLSVGGTPRSGRSRAQSPFEAMMSRTSSLGVIPAFASEPVSKAGTMPPTRPSSRVASRPSSGKSHSSTGGAQRRRARPRSGLAREASRPGSARSVASSTASDADGFFLTTSFIGKPSKGRDRPRSREQSESPREPPRMLARGPRRPSTASRGDSSGGDRLSEPESEELPPHSRPVSQASARQPASLLRSMSSRRALQLAMAGADHGKGTAALLNAASASKYTALILKEGK